MLVSELIEKLLKMPQSMEVCFQSLEFTSPYNDFCDTASPITTVEQFEVIEKNDELYDSRRVDHYGEYRKTVVLIRDND